MTKEQMLEQLTAGICVVKFTKINGEERKMLCTRDIDLVEKFGNDAVPKGTGRSEPDDQVRVFDLNAEAWRSFKVDRVIEFQGPKPTDTVGNDV